MDATNAMKGGLPQRPLPTCDPGGKSEHKTEQRAPPQLDRACLHKCILKCGVWPVGHQTGTNNTAMINPAQKQCPLKLDHKAETSQGGCVCWECPFLARRSSCRLNYCLRAYLVSNP